MNDGCRWASQGAPFRRPIRKVGEPVERSGPVRVYPVRRLKQGESKKCSKPTPNRG